MTEAETMRKYAEAHGCGEKEYYEKVAVKIYGDIREAVHQRINSILTRGRTDVVVSPEITHAIDLIIDRLQDAVQYQIKAELAKHGISSIEQEG